MSEDFVKYLKERHFDKTLKKYIKKYKDKKVVIYGTGLLFECIVNNYELSQLNIIAVSDRKYQTVKPDKYLGFDTVSPDKIKDLAPDVVLVSVLKTVVVLESLRYDILKDTKIKVLPLVDRHFFEIIKEIWY